VQHIKAMVMTGLGGVTSRSH